MFGKFLPRSTDFFEFFEKHIVVVIQAAKDLLEMIDQEHLGQIKQSRIITSLEKEADAITHHCIDALHKTFITPFERNDIYALITGMDDIVDTIEDVATRIVLYKLDTRTREINDLVAILYSSTVEIQKVLSAIHKGEPQKNIHQTLMLIHQLENEADDIVNKDIGRLFDEEKDPINLIKWKEIYENLEEAIDCCETVANIVEGMLIESS